MILQILYFACFDCAVLVVSINTTVLQKLVLFGSSGGVNIKKLCVC